MSQILILTAAYGEGHNAAARGLHTALAEHPGVTARIWDPLAECFGGFYERSRRSYLRTIDRRPQLWAFSYRLLDRTPLIFVLAWFLFRVRRALRQALAAEPPAAVVSVYPLYPFLLGRLFPQGGRPFRLFTVVTDSITINSVWHRAASDLFFVPNEDTAEAMRGAAEPMMTQPIHFARGGAAPMLDVGCGAGLAAQVRVTCRSLSPQPTSTTHARTGHAPRWWPSCSPA